MFDGAFSIWHIGLVALVAVILFYKGDKLPDAARSVGRSLRVFKTEIKGIADDDKARDAHAEARDSAGPDPSSGSVGMTKTEPARTAIEAPSAPVARVVAEPSDAIPVHAEVVRPDPSRPDVVGTGAATGSGSRPRPRPGATGSSSTD